MYCNEYNIYYHTIPRQRHITTPSTCYFIGGGQNNTICAGATHSAIVGGQGNCVIHNWATVAGCGVTSVMDCAFHTNNVVAQNMPDSLMGPFPTGTLYFDIITNIVYRQY